MKDIFIYGPPASGKSTLGRRLAEGLGCPFVDLDSEIASRAGKSIPEIFASGGEAAFRELEDAALRAIAAAPEPAGRIVALGGGTLLRDGNREFCESAGMVLCLDSPGAEELERRLSADGATRPLGDRSAERAEHYTSFGNRVTASFELSGSFVMVGNGLAPALIGGRSIAADARVAELYRSCLDEPLAIVPSGEENKNLGTVTALWKAFASAGIGRRNAVAAVGGGVTGDLVGFAAATWMRGIDWINVPTTLLSMVDSSIGGKTGFDLPEGKNLVGAFHSPRLVIVDADFLRTLPPERIAEGRAEMIKHEIIGGLVRGADLSAPPSVREIAASLRVKAAIVAEDPFERFGRRLLLNCGHTVAHALEKLSGYRLSHGDAVAIGCVEEARLAAARGLAPLSWPEELARRFRSAGLPTAVPDGLDVAGLGSVMRGDKKHDGDTVDFALPCGWGDVRRVPVDLAGGCPR